MKKTDYGFDEPKPRKQGRTAQLGKHNRRAAKRSNGSEFIKLMKAKDFACEGSFVL